MKQNFVGKPRMENPKKVKRLPKKVKEAKNAGHYLAAGSKIVPRTAPGAIPIPLSPPKARPKTRRGTRKNFAQRKSIVLLNHAEVFYPICLPEMTHRWDQRRSGRGIERDGLRCASPVGRGTASKMLQQMDAGPMRGRLETDATPARRC